MTKSKRKRRKLERRRRAARAVERARERAASQRREASDEADAQPSLATQLTATRRLERAPVGRPAPKPSDQAIGLSCGQIPTRPTPA
jgi:hypothetical protein